MGARWGAAVVVLSLSIKELLALAASGLEANLA
jgi:hypothetical protein